MPTMNPGKWLTLIAGVLLVANTLFALYAWGASATRQREYKKRQKELADFDAWSKTIGYERPKIVPKKGGKK